jgi:hypothetical protein
MLQEEHCVLEVHGLEFRSKLEEESSAHVAVELREAIFFSEVSVVKPHYLVDVEFSCKLAGNPAVSEIHERDINLFQVLEDVWVNLLDDCLHLIEYLVYSRLLISIIVLHIVDEFAQAPEDISLNFKNTLKA